MSRCFPFPPPGYEKKASPDEVNLITKEKHKQKKHKDKDKKDKDKKERSKRKEERSEGKNKEDKDRKQKKHRDKKDKNKDKQRSLEEKKVVGSLENQNGEKLGLDCKPSDGIQDYRILVELENRVRNDNGATDSQMVHKVTLTEHRKVNFLGKVEESGGNMLAEAYEEIKYKRENGRMANGQILEVDARRLGNGLVGSFSGENQNKVEGGSCQVDKFEKTKEGVEKNKDKKSDGKGDRHKNKDRDENRKAEDKKRKRENKKEKVKERNKEQIQQREIDGNNVLDFHNNRPSDLLKESCDSQGNLPKRKEPELNGFLHDNGIRPNNISRLASSSRRTSQNGSDTSQNIIDGKGGVIMGHNVNGKVSSSQSAIKNVCRIELGQTANNFRAEHGRAPTNNHVVSNGPLSSHLVGMERKMKPCQTTSNVAKVEQGVNKHRVDDKVPSSHPVVDNGRKMVRSNIDKAAEVHGHDASCKMDTKESNMNGLLDGQLYTSSKVSFTSIKAKEKVDMCMKPPHPDSKYLNQILTIPRVEWSQYDAQEWLFDCKDSQAKSPKLAFSQIVLTKHVWAEAIHVESADVTALPFVIPY